MKKLIVVAVLCVLCASVQAAVINIDMEKSGAEVTFSGQGAYLDAGNDYWNSAPGGEASAMLQSDVTTLTAVAITTGSGSGHDYGSAGHAMLGDYNYTRDNPSTISISGLAVSQAYGLYVYLGGDNTGQITTVTLDGRTITQTSAYQGTDYVQGPEGNWMYIWADTDAAGVIDGTFDAADGRYGAIRGLQIVEVPEPATMLLLGLGGLFLKRRRIA